MTRTVILLPLSFGFVPTLLPLVVCSAAILEVYNGANNLMILVSIIARRKIGSRRPLRRRDSVLWKIFAFRQLRADSPQPFPRFSFSATEAVMMQSAATVNSSSMNLIMALFHSLSSLGCFMVLLLRMCAIWKLAS